MSDDARDSKTDLSQSWAGTMPRSSTPPAGIPESKVPTPRELKRALDEEKDLERQRVDAWTAMGDHMLSVVRTIQKNEAGQRRLVQLVVLATLANVAVASTAGLYVSDKMAAVERIELDTARVLGVVMQQADAQAKGIEAQAADDPELEAVALQAAVSVQEEAAKAQIDSAEAKEETPSPAATRALRDAQKKAEKLKVGERLKGKEAP